MNEVTDQVRPAEDPDGARSEIDIGASRDMVYAHLIDPRTYPDWLVGAQHIRGVDSHWPDRGAQFHHRVGLGPLTIDDATTLVSANAPRELVLRAAVGPLGAAIVRFRLTGSNRTVVHFDEAPDAGFLRAVGTTVGRWILKASVWGRNEVSLQQLKDLVEAVADSADGEHVGHPGVHLTGESQAAIHRDPEPPV